MVSGELVPGAIVKSKTFPSWGLGVIKKELKNELVVVVFPDVKNSLKKEEQMPQIRT